MALACAKHTLIDVAPDVLTVRFNFDSIPADIHAVNFYSDAYSPAISSARIVVGTVPQTRITRADLKIDKDFASDIRAFPPIEPPIEFVRDDDWLSLAVTMPTFPLSGLTILAMLETTDVAACAIHGMDFYANDHSIPIQPSGKRGKHFLPSARSWLEALLRRDGRFSRVG